jgi:hypothetical protein
MNRREDPMSMLRGANPVPEADMPAVDSPQAEALFERIVRTDPSAGERVRSAGRPRLRRRRTALVLIPVAILALGATGYGVFRSVSQPLQIVCHARMALGSSVQPVSGPVDDPVAACAEVRDSGGSLRGRGASAQPLQACVFNEAIHVFPHPEGVDACEALDLPRPPVSSASEETKAAHLVENALAKAFLFDCVPESPAVNEAHRTLVIYGLTEWKVAVVARAFTDRYPCAGASVDVAARTVWIAPVPPPSTP